MLVGLHRLWWLIVRPKRPNTIKCVAFLGLSELGSTIIADPAVRRARELFSGTEVYFVIFAGNRGYLGILGRIDPQRMLTIRENYFLPFVLDSLAAIRTLRRVRTDIIVDLELFSRYTSILSLLSGAPIRTGFHRFLQRGPLPRQSSYPSRTIQSAPAHGEEFPCPRLRRDRGAGYRSALQTPLRRCRDSSRTLREERRQRGASRAPSNRWVLLNQNASRLIPLRR